MNKLKFWRLERALSQFELAFASGIPRWSVQLIESGLREPSDEERAVLCKALGVSALQLFGDNVTLNVSEVSND